MALMLYNTLSRSKEAFQPLGKVVGLYSCGPTVYNYVHLGNLRAFLFADVLKRVLLYNEYKVKHVMNITDVGHLTDDGNDGEEKLEKGAKREGKTVWEVAQFYTDAFFEDIDKLNILRADKYPKATDHIKEQIVMVETLEKKGFTYTTTDGVYFDVSKFPTYGDFAKLKLDSEAAQARVDENDEKKNPQDFALWKFCVGAQEKHTMRWDSKWHNAGFPGWHIECSAMSMKHLGEHFDIHTGGIDHIPVHHTNEIAQSEGVLGKKWVNFWMHNEFLVLKGDIKMAKSGENFLTLNTLADKGYSPLDYRYLCLTASYRSPLSFSFEVLQGAKESRTHLVNAIVALKEDGSSVPNSKTEEYAKEFLAAVNDDLNTAKALAVLYEVLKDKSIGAKERLEVIYDFDKVFGLDLKNAKRDEVAMTAELQKLVDKREEARKNKDYATADSIRDELTKKGYSVEDTATGPRLVRL